METGRRGVLGVTGARGVEAGLAAMHITGAGGELLELGGGHGPVHALLSGGAR